IHVLRGDLDWIVMKALEKDRARRYETANGLARDVERYLSGEPIVARPPSKFYRLQKLARRNKLAFAAAGGRGCTDDRTRCLQLPAGEGAADSPAGRRRRKQGRRGGRQKPPVCQPAKEF